VAFGVASQYSLALGVPHYYLRANFDNRVSIPEEETLRQDVDSEARNDPGFYAKARKSYVCLY
jgi:hypothetical protein